MDVEREVKHEYTGKIVGIDNGLEYFTTDSDGQVVENPRYLRKAQKRLKRLHRRVSKRKKGGRNRKKAINRMARQHLKVSRKRKDFAVKAAGALVASNDLISYEHLQVRNLVKNHTLAKSISDASWSMFVDWVEYFARVAQGCNCGSTASVDEPGLSVVVATGLRRLLTLGRTNAASVG